MTQIALACAIASVDQEEPSCNPEGTDTSNWHVVIDEIKGGEGSAESLLNNMTSAGRSPPGYPTREFGLANLFACSPSTFPCQTHHLIPERQLPDHPVTAWLTDAPKGKCKHAEYELTGDTEYDTNGAENGYYLPFAATTYQWSKSVALRNRTCFEMMRLTKMQLHQGPHSKSKDYGEDPDSEEFSPYKETVELFLNEIHRQVTAHVDQCLATCQKDGKEKIPPLASTVAMVEQVSFLLKVLLQKGKIVVSGRAGAYRNTYAPKGEGYSHPSVPFVTEDDFK